MTSTNIHLESETTQKFNIPLSHLDFGYINKCSNVKELEKILIVLRSGTEGKYPELEALAEQRLQTVAPKSRVLRKDGPILRPGDLSCGDWKQIENDLQNWTSSMKERDLINGKKNDINQETDENVPPVRASNVLEGKKQKKSETDKNKRVTPRDYKEWDKFDVEAELNKTETEKKVLSKKTDVNGVTLDINVAGLSLEEKEMKANREKEKGNEAFRSKDFKESVLYYTRSISLLPTAASYNNRALAYLKLEEWDKAIADCNSVLKKEEANVKALLRRATAYKSQKKYTEALVDLKQVLNMESNNKTAKDMFESINSCVQQEMQSRKEKGKRLVIEEVDNSDEVNEVSSCLITENEIKNVVKETASEVQEKNLLTSADIPVSLDKSSLSSTESADIPVSLDKSSLSSTESADIPVSLDKSSLSSTESADIPVSNDESPISSTDLVDVLASQNQSSFLSTGLDDIPASQDDQPILSTDSDVTSALTSNQDCKFQDNLTEESQKVDESKDSFSLTRPYYVQLSLPSNSRQFKESGNTLFRSGQYGDASDEYTKAILELEKDNSQQVNLSVLLNNRAACHLKIGHCSQTVQDCTHSLLLVPHNIKALLRRAAAYEILEKYGDAYVDYKHVLSIDKSTEQALQGANRCQSILQNLYGPGWRQKVSPLVSVQPWEVPLLIDQSDGNVSILDTIKTVLNAPEQLALGDTKTVDRSEEIPDKGQEKIIDTTKEKTVDTNKEKTVYKEKTVESQTKKKVEACEEKTGETSEEKIFKTNEQRETSPLSKTEKFEKLKQIGNDLVQKGLYEEAVKYYSSCIELCPEQSACFTNRALCYLKLNKPTEAALDCTSVLNVQANNPKALYRRALAHKMLLQYKSSLQDLIELVKLEPKNCAAQKEIDAVKMLYKQELEKLKASKPVDQETKLRKRIKIEEVEDEDDNPKVTKDKSKTQGKGRSVKNLQQFSSKTKVAPKCHSVTTSDSSVTPTPPIASRLMKTTPYEFFQAWNSLKPSQGIQPYTEILRQVLPENLPSVISNKLDGQMLQIIVRCVNEEMVAKGEVDLGFEILDNLRKVPRFSTVALFMSSKEKKEVSTVLDVLSRSVSSLYTPADIVRLKKEYSVK
ncbi:sperm-associated antigen 1-like isoform X2 [Biomphalaria glabrata]|nr:sperm-associated antigen 1-like isoform X2 [Biomphalaria glabrata]